MYITGGVALRGRVRVSGAKNDVLPKLAATLLFDGAVSLTNVPHILDVARMVSLLQSIGARVTYQAGRVCVNTDNLSVVKPASHLVGKLRHSFCLTGPLLARIGEVVMPVPGGCAIGARPVNFHTAALRKLGADVIEREDRIIFSLGDRKFRGGTICLPGRFRSVGTTNHVMMTAVLGEGVVHILNASGEPETVALGRMLMEGGAEIEGLGTNTLTIRGRQGKLLKGGQFRVIGDRQEAATFMLAAVATGGDVRVDGVAPADTWPILKALACAGARQIVNGNGVRVGAGRKLKPWDIMTAPFPGFPTDIQPLWTALMTQARGTTRIREDIFEERIGHVAKLWQLGANIRVVGEGRERRIEVKGKSNLRGAERLVAADIREGAALLLGALCAKGTTSLDATIMDRGYENLGDKLRSLGANIEE